MLRHRIISSLAWVVIIFLTIKFKAAFFISIMALTAAGLYEFFGLIEKKGIHIYKYFGMAIGIIIPLTIFFNFEMSRGWELLFIVVALLSIFILQLKRRDNSQAVVGISTTFFGILYVSWFLSFLIKIRDFSPGGEFYLLSIILITKSSDIGAYVIGKKWGSHQLLPRISPNKSVEGSLGGLFFSAAAAMLCRPFLNFNYLILAALGIGLGLLAQLGDLSESLIKRDCQVKDSGRLFPGLGGVLDLVDSLLFTAPVFYFFMGNILNTINT